MQYRSLTRSRSWSAFFDDGLVSPSLASLWLITDLSPCSLESRELCVPVQISAALANIKRSSCVSGPECGQILIQPKPFQALKICFPWFHPKKQELLSPFPLVDHQVAACSQIHKPTSKLLPEPLQPPSPSTFRPSSFGPTPPPGRRWSVTSSVRHRSVSTSDGSSLSRLSAAPTPQAGRRPDPLCRPLAEPRPHAVNLVDPIDAVTILIFDADMSASEANKVHLVEAKGILCLACIEESNRAKAKVSLSRLSLIGSREIGFIKRCMNHKTIFCIINGKKQASKNSDIWRTQWVCRTQSKLHQTVILLNSPLRVLSLHNSQGHLHI
ncbi:hypothetical protein IEQ34_004974 [Dendrobium chrysotoxum]|uniref:Uncharacterized protein n=1 Tax=Dendrobium chrysotoxum TaxID=161865 RepID=A0AAV7H8D5_DENCH|nr:hypothetical protein IEQ34_004974 [Dendrobium chrysotoxum]